MAERDLYTSDQLAKIRATLENTLGDSSGNALENLDNRFVAKEDAPVDDDNNKVRKKRKQEEETADIRILLEENKLKKMLDAVHDIKDHPDDIRMLIEAILRHKEVKAFHMVDALSKINKDNVELVEALVTGITACKGVNPLIDALRYSVASPSAIKSLAMGIAEQGTVNHLIRAIATAPRDQHDAEVIWAMEVMGKGSMEQLLEAIKLLDDNSPGTVILATGLVNRKEVAIEPLVRALTASKNNAKACSILSVALTHLADVTQLVSLLEKYVSDDTESAEILVSKLVLQSLREKGRSKVMAKVVNVMRGESMAGKILAMGIVEQGSEIQMKRAYNRMKSHPVGQRMLAVAIKNKLGGLKAVKLLGGVFFKVAKFESEVRTATAEAKKRYKDILANVLLEQEGAPARSAKDDLQNL